MTTLSSADQTPFINASRRKRFAAMMYEGALLFGVVFIADYLFDALTQSRHGLVLREARQLVIFLAIGLYFMASWRRGGQTLPMRAWHIQLVRPDQKRLNFGQLTLRYILSWIIPLVGFGILHWIVMETNFKAAYMLAVGAPFLIFIPTWFRRDGQFLHDIFSGTRIVDIRHLTKR
ncbi:RDD family protein [Orrella sp. 11846]|uniref:RDD family protein n=1 Tax=Orrella sp. 11846 TaxID=3409913 RepID=UPI003B59A8FC